MPRSAALQDRQRTQEQTLSQTQSQIRSQDQLLTQTRNQLQLQEQMLSRTRAQMQIHAQDTPAIQEQLRSQEQQQLRTVGIGLGGGIDDFLGIAGQIAHDKIQLGDANGKRHGRRWGRSGLHKLCGTRPCLRPA